MQEGSIKIKNKVPFHEKNIIRRRFLQIAALHTDNLFEAYEQGKDDPQSTWARIMFEAAYAVKIHHGVKLKLEVDFEK